MGQQEKRRKVEKKRRKKRHVFGADIQAMNCPSLNKINIEKMVDLHICFVSLHLNCKVRKNVTLQADICARMTGPHTQTSSLLILMRSDVITDPEEMLEVAEMKKASLCSVKSICSGQCGGRGVRAHLRFMLLQVSWEGWHRFHGDLEEQDLLSNYLHPGIQQ